MRVVAFVVMAVYKNVTPISEVGAKRMGVETMRAEVVGHIGGPARAAKKGFNHPIYQPGTREVRAEVFEAYAEALHPAWSEANGDAATLYRFVVDISMRSYEGRSFQSISLLGVSPERVAAPTK